MTLGDLLRDVPVVAGAPDPDAPVQGLAYDSRRVRPGDVFFALRGVRQDGQSFVRDALAAGAAAVVVGPEVPISDPRLLGVDEPRRALALAARALHHDPSRALEIVGVTGTNGKTTTTYLLESIFRAAGRRTGVIGTTGYRLEDEARPAPFTTPEAPELQGLLREMRERGIESVAIELSSHALVQRRCYGLACRVAIFTNLTHDHLDFHGTLERYLDAKLMLFDGRNQPRPEPGARAVINADDEHAGRVLQAAAQGGMKPLRFGRAASADVRITAVRPLPRGLGVDLQHPDGVTAFTLPLLGRHNAWNAAGAFAAARALGISAEDAARGLSLVPGVPGRLEWIEEGQPFDVVVDYAHTPDALSAAISAVREHTRGRVLLIFGCGGDRDRAKRPLMGQVAAARADRAWITNDNPRGEDPAAIAAEIRSGAERPIDVVLDRREALAQALRAARPGDAVLVAGKGHEGTQTIGDRVLAFDDRVVARELLRQSAGARG